MDNEFVAVPLRGISTQYLEFFDDGRIGNHILNDEEVAKSINYYNTIIREGNLMDTFNKGIMMVILRRDEDNNLYEVCTKEKITCDGVNLICDGNELINHYEDINSILDCPLVVSSDLIFKVSDREKNKIESYCKSCYKDTLKKKFRKLKKDAIMKDMVLLDAFDIDINHNRVRKMIK